MTPEWGLPFGKAKGLTAFLGTTGLKGGHGNAPTPSAKNYRLPCLLDYLETVIDKTLATMFRPIEIAEYWHIRSIAYFNAGRFNDAFQDAYASSRIFQRLGLLEEARKTETLAESSIKAMT